MSILLIVNWLALVFSLFVVGCLLGVTFSRPFRKQVERFIEKLTGLKLSRVGEGKPLMEPTHHYWETEAVLNPAAAIIGGRTHLMYRAVGGDGISRLGYASSPDGIFFDERLPYPAYVCITSSTIPGSQRRYNPVMFPSGGSWGGCEDPRMVSIGGRVYVTFNMFQDWTLRVGCVSMSEEDFVAKRFHKWEGPIILSHGSRDKNWVLFPEKINGQFAVLHSIIGETTDRVRIEYTDDLATLSLRKFESPDPQTARDTRIAWHVHVRSAGPPPLKTDKGWLVLYHAHDEKEPSKYKLGAMLLDLTDPTKILHRSASPILSPDSYHENNGKPGIVYACGAVVRNGMLYVYYGGADRVVCAATAPLTEFVNDLVKGGQVVLVPERLQAA